VIFFTGYTPYATFFYSQATLEQFTHSLDSLPKTEACQHCGKNDQWIAHGNTYKSLNHQATHTTGKRILCSNRYGRSGCGRTRQLYLNDTIPNKHYTLSVFIAFIQALLLNHSVQQSDRNATGNQQCEPRQAWRWLNLFMQVLSHWRTLASLSLAKELNRQKVTDKQPQKRTYRFNILLPTLQTIIERLPLFQARYQAPFL